MDATSVVYESTLKDEDAFLCGEIENKFEWFEQRAILFEKFD